MFKRRWSPAARNLLWVGVSFALMAAILMRGYEQQVASRDPGPMVTLVTAAHEIPAGTIVGAADLSSAAVPQRTAPTAAIDREDLAIGTTALGPIGVGEILTRTRLASGGPVAVGIPAGLRAIILPSGLPPGSVRAGDLVDVLATHTQGAVYTDTVAQAVEVMRIIPMSQDLAAASAPGGGGDSLALIVDTTTAEGVAQAMHTAVVTISINSAKDRIGDTDLDGSAFNGE